MKKSKMSGVASPETPVSREWDAGFSVGHRHGFLDAIRALIKSAHDNKIAVNLGWEFEQKNARVEEETRLKDRLDAIERKLDQRG